MDPTQVIHAANLDPNMLGTVSRKLDDVLDAKNGAIKVCDAPSTLVFASVFIFRLLHRICNMSLPASQRLTMMSFAFTNPNLQSLVFRSKSLGSGHLSHQLVPVLQDWWWGENLFPVDPMR